MVVADDDVAEGRETLLDALYADFVGEGVAEVLEFLVGGCGGDEKTFSVTFFSLLAQPQDKNMLRESTTYPAVNRPMIRVPAIVVLQMGMTSWSSASNTL